MESNSTGVNLTRGFRVFIIGVFEIVCVLSVLVSFIIGFVLMTMYARYGAELLGFLIFVLTVLGTVVAAGFAFVLLDIADNVRTIARKPSNIAPLRGVPAIQPALNTAVVNEVHLDVPLDKNASAPKTQNGEPITRESLEILREAERLGFSIEYSSQSNQPIVVRQGTAKIYIRSNEDIARLPFFWSGDDTRSG